MEIGETIYVTDRAAWRAWLRQYSSRLSEIWLIYCRKDSGKPSLPYDHAVEEALCFGWIDSTVKSVDAERYAQRFTPRKKGSELSMLNLIRVENLVRQRKMTKQGLEALKSVRKPCEIGKDIFSTIRKHPIAWKHFSAFPENYKRIRLSWIESARKTPDLFAKRLAYFIAMTQQNKQFGTKVSDSRKKRQ